VKCGTDGELCCTVLKKLRHNERGVDLMTILSQYDVNKEVREAVDKLFQQHLHIEGLKEAYRQSVLISLTLGKQISERQHFLPERESMNPEPSPFPPCLFFEHTVGGKVVYQLSYSGMLPLYDRENKYRSAVRDYYIEATVNTLRPLIRSNKVTGFAQALLYFCHFFDNKVLRDLDNRNRSILINALRYSGLLAGDTWQHVETMESGFFAPDGTNHIELFITSQENGLDMIRFIKQRVGTGYNFRVQLDTKT
jgi:hypothetical protein